VLCALGLARRFGASPLASAIAALGAFAFPWSVFNAWAATVPEMPCVALLLAGVLVLANAKEAAALSVGRAVVAGLLLGAACGHRYEAWFAAAGIVIGAASANRARESRRAVLALVGASLIVPIAWLALRYAHDGSALGFVARVGRYRAAHEALPAWPVRVVRYPLLFVGAAGLFAIVAAMGARVVGSRAMAVGLGAGAALMGLVIIDVSGGGPTHHAGRALLPSVWLLAPLAARGITEVALQRRAIAFVVAGAMLVQLGWSVRAVPRDVDAQTVATGRMLGERVSGGGCYMVEAERLDFLWLEAASGWPERARPDRAYAGSAPSENEFARVASACAVAAVSSERAQGVLARVGFREVGRSGAWSVWTR
jgi:hypothetical protein